MKKCLLAILAIGTLALAPACCWRSSCPTKCVKRCKPVKKCPKPCAKRDECIRPCKPKCCPTDGTMSNSQSMNGGNGYEAKASRAKKSTAKVAKATTATRTKKA